MAGERAFADYAMMAPGKETQDFWIWRAGRGSFAGAAEDGRLTPEGREGDGPGPFEQPNSARAVGEEVGAFSQGDSPLQAPSPQPGATAPGSLLVTQGPGRLEVQAASHWEQGRWTLTLSRPLTGSEAEDATFRAGGEYRFGLAVLDGVSLDHNAARAPVRLYLVPTAEAAGGGGE